MAAKLATTPNVLTLSRILVLPLLAILIEKDENFWACVVLTLAGFSDLLDGYIARRNKQESDFGRLMDPVADKVLLCVGVLFLVARGEDRLSPWLGSLLLAREFLVTGLRAMAASRGLVLPAGNTGKWKAFFQFIGLGAYVWGGQMGGFSFAVLGQILLWASVVLSYVALVQYSVKIYRELWATKKRS